MITEPHKSMFRDLTTRFLTEFRSGRRDFSHLADILFRLIRTAPEPALEFVWFHSAVSYHSSRSSLWSVGGGHLSDCLVGGGGGGLDVVSCLFRSLTLMTSACDDGVKRVAVLAPVLYQVCNLVSSLRRGDVDDFVEGVVGYISLCCGGSVEERDGGDLDVELLDLVPVWVVDRLSECCGVKDGLRLFFPLLTDDIRSGLVSECRVGYLAGAVMIEAFLLSLVSKFGSGVSGRELEEKLKTTANQAINVFQKNWVFADMILRLLLEPQLPVGNLLTSEDEFLIRKVLFDVVLKKDGAFLSPSRCDHIPKGHFRDLMLVWLFVADTATHFVRENGDFARLAAYQNAFMKSHFSENIICWIQGTTVEKLTVPDIFTAEDVINWLLKLECHGVKVFVASISELHAKTYRSGRCEFVDDGEQEPEVCAVNLSSRQCGRRKREEGAANEEVIQNPKLAKYTCQLNSTDDGLNNRNEFRNHLACDAEMVDVN